VGGKISEPRKTRNVPPVYPEVAKHARVQGTVILEATISPQGRVADLKVLRGIPMLDDAALSAVRQWTYTPTLLNGQPVPVIMTVTVNFRLDGSSGVESVQSSAKPSKDAQKAPPTKVEQRSEPEPPATAPAPPAQAPPPAAPPATPPPAAPAPEPTPPPNR
jgi:protein TonB